MLPSCPRRKVAAVESQSLLRAPMSSIRPDPRLDRPGLNGLGGDAPSLEELRGRDVPRAADAAAEAVLADTAPPGAAVDAGEHVLNAPAWAGVAPPRLLNAEPVLTPPAGFELER